MDNLTHSLVGALIGQMGLKRKTGLAMPALIIAANIPDIDAVATLFGGHEHLAVRRGITHGPIAMVVLPLLLWGVMLRFDAWQTRRGKRPEKRLPIHKGWLLVLVYIGCLTHPLFDWFNSYGIRLLAPFSSQWFYGDTLFIVDLWIWIALGLGVWLSLRRERAGSSKWRSPAKTAFIFMSIYVFANGAITGWVEKMAMEKLLAELPEAPIALEVVANPVPLMFACREVLWRDKANYGGGNYCPGSGVRLTGVVAKQAHLMRDPTRKINLLSGRVEDTPSLRAFLFWSRMPVQSDQKRADGDWVVIADQRFDNELTRDRFKIEVKVTK